jgi:hypothetical protein
MKFIPLTQGKYTKVDDEDYDWLMQWKWFFLNGAYAARHTKGSRNTKRKFVFMHREICHTPAEMETDHIDGDGLNNQRGNLRHCTSQQNNRNRGIRENHISGFKGVSWRSDAKKWRAYINLNMNENTTFLGLYSNPEEAARAYDVSARKAFGEFAHLNFPEQVTYDQLAD